MNKTPFLKIYDDKNGFKITVFADGKEKLVYDQSKQSFTTTLENLSKILNIENILNLIGYGDELFYDFKVDLEQIDKLDFSNLNLQLKNILPILKKEIEDQKLSQEITAEMNDNLISDLASSLFDAYIAQYLVFILNAARDIHIEDILFSSELIEVPRFKKLVSEELNRYGFNLMNTFQI